MPSRPDPSKGEKHASCQWRRSRRPRPDRSGRGICVHPHRRTSQPYPPDPGKEPGPPGGHAARTGGHLHGRRLRPHDGQARRGHAHRRTGVHQLYFALAAGGHQLHAPAGHRRSLRHGLPGQDGPSGRPPGGHCRAYRQGRLRLHPDRTGGRIRGNGLSHDPGRAARPGLSGTALRRAGQGHAGRAVRLAQDRAGFPARGPARSGKNHRPAARG